MSYSSKNYKPDAETIVIGGKVVVESGASFDGVPLASASKVENQAASTATTVADLKTDFNALLTRLKTAGIMVADA